MKLPNSTLDDVERIKIISEHVDGILGALSLDPDNPQLQETPQRIAKMYVTELFRGLYDAPPEVKLFPSSSDGVVTVEVPFTSTCAHHFLPFFGTVTISYAPKGLVAGLSKFNRVVRHFSAKPQLQEILTQEVCDYLVEKINPEWLTVSISASHTCVTARGIRDTGSITTTQATVQNYL